MAGIVRARYTLEFKQEVIRLVQGAKLSRARILIKQHGVLISKP